MDTNMTETPAEEFHRLVVAHNEPDSDSAKEEAWNQIADFALEHGDTIIKALSPSRLSANDEGVTDEVRQALIWYENNVAGCRLIHSGGDKHRAALADDGGKRARSALDAFSTQPPTPASGEQMKVVAWRYCSHDINGEPWPWVYQEQEPHPDHAHREPLVTLEAANKALDDVRAEIERFRQERSFVVGWNDGFAAAEARIERLEKALSEIASQKKTDELETEYDVEVASFEDGYDMCIDRARAAIRSLEGK